MSSSGLYSLGAHTFTIILKKTGTGSRPLS